MLTINMTRPLLYAFGRVFYLSLYFANAMCDLPAYSKPHLSLEDQLVLLKSRGLNIEDEAAAKECLRRNGYYRLSAYWHSFRTIVPQTDDDGKALFDEKGDPLHTRSHQFLADSKFKDAQELYVFDKRFKLLLLDAIERIEIAARAEIALCLGEQNPFAHTDPAFFRSKFIESGAAQITADNPDGKSKHEIWLEKFSKSVSASRDVFVEHHTKKYGEGAPMPLWIAIEIWDFGMLSKFYSGMEANYCDCVAARFGIPKRKLMASWLHTINYVRNIIAHHGRLWNRGLVMSPSSPPAALMPDFAPVFSHPDAGKRIYSVCCILCHFTKIVNAESTWPQQLVALIDEFPVMPYASISDMGFPDDWKSHNFWN